MSARSSPVGLLGHLGQSKGQAMGEPLDGPWMEPTSSQMLATEEGRQGGVGKRSGAGEPTFFSARSRFEAWKGLSPEVFTWSEATGP